MCEYQGSPLARVTLGLGLPYLLVNRALVCLQPVFFSKGHLNARAYASV